MVFVDTSAIVGLLVKSDQWHKPASDWVKSNKGTEMLTTDYILDEAYTKILKDTGDKIYTLQILNDFRDTQWLTNVEFLTEKDFDESVDVFWRYKDKGWSFTDCTCKVVMKRLGIETAFSFDRYFRQFERCTVVPNT